jgi:hypothetical protein
MSRGSANNNGDECWIFPVPRLKSGIQLGHPWVSSGQPSNAILAKLSWVNPGLIELPNSIFLWKIPYDYTELQKKPILSLYYSSATNSYWLFLEFSIHEYIYRYVILRILSEKKYFSKAFSDRSTFNLDSGRVWESSVNCYKFCKNCTHRIYPYRLPVYANLKSSCVGRSVKPTKVTFATRPMQECHCAND